MNLVLTWIDAEFCLRLTMSLLHSVWQLTLLAVIVTVADRILCRGCANRSFQLYVAALILGAAALPATYLLLGPPATSAQPPVSPSAIHVAEADDAGQFQADFVVNSAVAPRFSANEGASANAVDISEPTVWAGMKSAASGVACLYLIGVVLMLCRLMLGIRYAQSVRRTAVEISDGPLKRTLQSLTDRWQMRVAPVLAYSSEVVVPQVVGITKWTILLPSAAMTGLSTSDLEMILAHELAHIRRHDTWIQLLQRVAESVLFFNPAMWFLSHRISALREYCCDDMTLRVATDSHSQVPPEARYAQALVQVAIQCQQNAGTRPAQRQQLATLAAAGRSPSELRRRVARLLGNPVREPLTFSRTGIMFFAVAIALSWTACLAWSQQANQSVTQLNVTLKGPEKVELGANVLIRSEVKNSGASTANDVHVSLLFDNVLKPVAATDQFRQPPPDDDKTKVVWLIPKLAPGATVTLEATFKTMKVIRATDMKIATRMGGKPRAAASHRLHIMASSEDEQHPVVSGQILLPDGKPAADVVIMTATDRYGWGEGFTNGNYTKTDENGRYRIVSKRWFPQRLFWLPDEYENNSRAVENKGGEQKPIRLKRARKIRGSVKDFEGNAVANSWVRAVGASRTPFTWAKTNEQGEFEFRPLPAGKYFLEPVRSYHEHLTGQLKFHPLKIAFNAVTYDLKAEGELKPAKIVAPETVAIRVNVVDADGQAMTHESVSIGDIGDFSNALIADSVAGQPGFYEFQFPKGEFIRDLKLRHSWDQIAYYQETPTADPIPAEALVLGKAMKDIDGIKITVRPSAKLMVQLKDADGNIFAVNKARFSVTVTHPPSLSPADRPTIAPRPRHLVPANSKGLHEFPGVVPNCDVTVDLTGDDYQAVAQRVRLSTGETRKIDLVVKEKTNAILRGKIVDENGNEVKQKGWLYSRGTYANENANVTNSYSSTEDHVARRYAVEVPRGTVELSLYTPGYAPAWLGPIEVAAKDVREDFDFTLTRGFSFPIQVSDPDGTPIAGAMILAHPEINGNVDGPNVDRVADNQGQYLFEHAADTRYGFRVTAAGFEPLWLKPIEIAADKLVMLTLKPSPITRGVVQHADNSPVDNAKIFRVAVDSETGGKMISGSDFGDEIGMTDERGHFELDSLSTDARYLMVIQADNNARMLAYNFVAGKDDIELVMPKRRDLRIKIIGDTNLLRHRRDKPYVGVRQHVPISLDNPRSRTVIGTDVVVTQTRDGGIALYQGLVGGSVKVSVGNQTKTVEVNEVGTTEVEFVCREPNDQAEVDGNDP